MHNNSLVPTSFQIEQVQDDGKDPSFSLSHNSAYLPPNTSNTVTIKYTPTIPGVVSCAYYRVSSSAGNELKFSCKGEAVGFDVELSVKSLNFGEVQIENSTNRVVNVVNNSDLPTVF